MGEAYYWNDLSDLAVLRVKVIAQAQLKKVIEYIEEELICGGRLGEPEQDGRDSYFLDAKCWQALLKEVG